MQDANWNVTSIADISGSIQERYSFSAFGIPKFLTETFSLEAASQFGWETLYTGYRYDIASLQYHVRSRVYHPALGSWLSRDPLFALDASSYSYIARPILFRAGYYSRANLLAYCANNPLVAVDPSGLSEIGTALRGKYLTRCGAGVVTLRTVTSFPAYTTLHDKKGELMKPSQNIREEGLKHYIKKHVPCDGKPHRVKLGELLGAGYDVGPNVFGWIPQESLIPDNEGTSGATFWIGTPHEVRVNGEFTVTCSSKPFGDGKTRSTYQLTNVDLSWEFKDEIDANPTSGDGGLMPWLEWGVDIFGDKLLGASYKLSVFMPQTTNMTLYDIQ